MKNDKYRQIVETSDFGKFANFFIKYLKGSASHDEAFIRASYTYRKLFKKIPYKSSKVFLAEFFRTQHLN